MSKKEKIVIFVVLPGGSGDFNWELNESGDSIALLVDWSKALYDASNLFRAELEAKQVILVLPKLHAMQSELAKKGISQKKHTTMLH